MNRRYVLRRLLLVVPTVLGVVTLTFVLVHAAPGDPAREFAGEGADETQIDAARAYLHLDRPLPEQYAAYLGHLARGDLGTSFSQRLPVRTLIAMRLWPTLLLTGTALALSVAAGLWLGIRSARRPHGGLDAGVNLASLACYAVPAFWLAQLGVLTLALRTGLLPAGGMNDPRAVHTGMAAALDTGRHLLLPALVLAISETALLLRVTRAGLAGERGREYVRAALAKGASEDEVVRRHAVPNTLLPVVTVIGSRVGFLVSGAVLVESVFNWPGLGRLVVDAGRAGDQPVILGMVLLVSAAVVVANLATDLLYAWIDPRVRQR
ncbi:MAG TPA: ABC transporter permease [Acidimicrobiales bacterium]|nr:ABC transporter permease [Acidimicrobiales bacterium]